jgi:hypothetical protein
MCPHTAIYLPCCMARLCPLAGWCSTIYVSAYYYMCPHAALYVSSYCYICVLICYTCVRILLYMCPHPAVYVFAYCYICVLILLYMCSHAATCVLIPLYMCPHTSVCVCPYCYICVLILLHMCPHTATYVSSYCYICVLMLLHMCLHIPCLGEVMLIIVHIANSFLIPNLPRTETFAKNLLRKSYFQTRLVCSCRTLLVNTCNACVFPLCLFLFVPFFFFLFCFFRWAYLVSARSFPLTTLVAVPKGALQFTPRYVVFFPPTLSPTCSGA